ncbi:response regulator [Massilia sp. YIM B02443]|uniref:response regulator n=1 Tax=Massilia sp. YIM B02443 TaxID=3050127 RepID=UPI0025B69D80|nr:response regulator [Massilia sp. YIM B02443]MDN4037657.1 response regulator [Massilia sp. YIM B02443]
MASDAAVQQRDPGTRALVVFAPLAGDAAALREVAAREALAVRECAGVDAFYAALDEQALAVVVTEEGLARCTLQALSARLRSQPAWSDLPLLVLADADRRDIDDGRFLRLQDVGNVILLTRPTTRLALAMALRSALRARRLQFDLRDQLAQLEGYAGRLASIVSERTRLLERETAERRRVEQALAEARRLESLGQLTGGIAHDFNNILQVVAGSETLLRMLLGGARADKANGAVGAAGGAGDGGATPDARALRALDGIRRATGHGAAMTQQLLAYARRQPLASTTLDLHTHLRATAEMAQRMLGAHIQLRRELAPDLWPALADPAQLDAALLNIVGNARDAMPDGGALTLKAANWTLPDPALPQGAHLDGEFVGIFLSDQGHGMSEETARQAFEPFFTTKPVGKGTGLGLSQVYGFAVQSDGQAFIRRETVGTTIGILLPRGRTQAAAPALDPATLRAAGLAGLRVLYVEDDADVADATGALLQSLGVTLRRADSTDAAVEALARDGADVDIVFSDVMMPGRMDGIELARWLATHHPRLPVVLTSGYMLSPERLQDLKVQFVRKPASIGAINDAFVNAMRRSDGEGTSRQRRRAG